jgi:hypothetical protein
MVAREAGQPSRYSARVNSNLHRARDCVCLFDACRSGAHHKWMDGWMSTVDSGRLMGTQ